MTAAKPTYSELLRDPRWQRRRLEIMNRADFSCEQCRDKSSTLNVHHKIYRKGAPPWEYSDAELVCLCETCHEVEHHLRNALNAAMSSMPIYQLERVLGYAQALEQISCDVPRPITVRSESHADGLMDGIWNWNSASNHRPSAECLIDHRVIDEDLLCMLGEGEMPAPDWKEQH